MELRLLKYFLTVAREETISGAAEVLHLTQPTLSRQMMDLEESLQVKLFTRGNRKITLTEEGMRLRKRAEEIVDLVEKTEAEFLIGNENISGDVYIGGGETYGMSLVAKVIEELRTDYPDIRFHLYSGNAEDVTEKLDKGLLDFGIIIEPANISKFNYLQLPTKDIWGVLMRKDDPLAMKKSISPEDLWDLPLIVSRQKLVDKDIEHWLKKDYQELNIVATYNLVYNASLLVAQGVGYALTLDKLVNTTGESNLCFIPLAPKMEVYMDIIWKKYQMFSKAGELFLNHLKVKTSFRPS